MAGTIECDYLGESGECRAAIVLVAAEEGRTGKGEDEVERIEATGRVNYVNGVPYCRDFILPCRVLINHR